VALGLLLIGGYESLELTWPGGDIQSVWNTLDVFVLAVVGLIAYLIIDRFLRLSAERQDLQERKSYLEVELEEALQRQNTLLRISQSFLDANNEEEVVQLVVRFAGELLSARGVSFVPLDENAQPMSATRLGEMPIAETDAWLEYLASPEVRKACVDCQIKESVTHSCPLLTDANHEASGVYCIPFRRGGQEFGLLNVFLPGGATLDSQAQSLLRTLKDETTIALESVRMRHRAMITLQQLQSLREQTDLNTLLEDLLDGLRHTLEADYVLLSIRDNNLGQEKTEISLGMQIPPDARYLIDGILQTVSTSGQPVLLENPTGGLASTLGLHAILAAPLLVAESSPDAATVGVILAASKRPRAFTQRQLTILKMIAGQVSLVLHNVRLVAQLEYKTMIEERMRLAREIHDGLAQTLGFLKLKMAQMRGFLKQGEDQLLGEAVDICYNVLADAYLDARQAIDGLRVSSKDGFAEWLQQTVDEFKEYSGVGVHIQDAHLFSNLPPEVGAQLIRIIQEALNNVRKHSDARAVVISCRMANGDLSLEIDDDGEGFNVEEVPGLSQHGLRGMRERAELIDAELQVISHAGKGTSVRVRLPVNEKERLA